MLEHSVLSLALLRVTMFLVDSISPVAILFTFYQLYQLLSHTTTPHNVEALAGSLNGSVLSTFLPVWFHLETFFFLYHHLQKHRLQAPLKPPAMSDLERGKMYYRVLDSTGDEFRAFFAGWFVWSHTQKQLVATEFHLIRKDNMRDWLSWFLFGYENYSMLLKNPRSKENAQELDEMINDFQLSKGFVMQPGRNSDIEAVILSYNRVDAYIKPLVFYTIIAICESVGFLILVRFGFSRVTTSDSASAKSSAMSYWVHTPSRKDKAHPIVFIHGIGCGLFPYVNFVAELQRKAPTAPIFLIELPHVAMRLKDTVPTMDEMIGHIETMLDVHGYSEAVFVGHSLGSSIAGSMIKYSKYVAGTVLVDPIVILTHHPSLAFNFVHRAPGYNTDSVKANELFMHWLCSRELFISYTISRHFIWHQIMLWHDDLPTNHHVIMCRKDLLLNAPVVEQYMIDKAVSHTMFDIDHGQFLCLPEVQTSVVERIACASRFVK